MDIQLLTKFFMWCTIIDGGLLVLWAVAFLAIPDFVYATQKRWFPVSRETFNIIMYGFLGLFKILFLMFNLVPLIALWIIG